MARQAMTGSGGRFAPSSSTPPSPRRQRSSWALSASWAARTLAWQLRHFWCTGRSVSGWGSLASAVCSHRIEMAVSFVQSVLRSSRRGGMYSPPAPFTAVRGPPAASNTFSAFSSSWCLASADDRRYGAFSFSRRAR